MRDIKWVRLLTYVTGLVNQRLLLQNQYLARMVKISERVLGAESP